MNYTTLRRRRRRKGLRLDDGDSKLDDEARKLKLDNPTSNIQSQDLTSSIQSLSSNDYYWEDIRIDQIQPGDEILTLGEAIRTTANHPYLVRNEELTFGRGLFIESNIGQKSHNHSQGKSYGYFGIYINKINHGFNPFLNLIAVNKQIIPSDTLTVNNPNLASNVVLEKGIPQAIINQPADKLTSKSDNVLITTGSNLPFINPTLSEQKLAVNQGEKGTTNPLGALHVAGQCVSGDTLLKIKAQEEKTQDDG